MENYRKSIKRRIYLLAAVAIFACCLGIFDVFIAPPEMKESYILGFQTGAITALGLVSVILIIRFSKLLRDEKKLQLQFNKENDERYKAIRGKAGMPMLLFTSVAMIIVGMIAGYFNSTIFLVLMIAATTQMLVGAIVKMIYLKKM